jgi:hypothetical protein
VKLKIFSNYCISSPSQLDGGEVIAPYPKTRWAPLQVKFLEVCQINHLLSIGDGSTENQKNLIPWLKLGLSRN